VDLARRWWKHIYQREVRVRVLPVVYMHHLSIKSLTDTGHAIADHLDGHARGEVQTEEYAVEERNRGAE
jgi:hypothetical protein